MKIRLFLLFALLLLPGISAAHFSDTDGHLYEEVIKELANTQIVKGYPDGTFKPDQGITRAEMVKIVLLAGKWEIMSGNENCFSDVSQEERYFDPLCSAKAMGIIQGYPDGTFKPNQKVSFVEGLKIAIEGFKIQTREVKSDFRYTKYLDFVHQNSIFSKYAFYPEQELTRGMMAHLAVKLLQGQSKNWDFVRDIRSPGCGKSQPMTPPSTVMVRGQERHFITKVGSNYSSSRPAKLIFAFHGRTSPNTGLGYYGIEDASDGNAIFVYPAGLPEEGPQRNWRSP